ncbi:unnamed protein product [Rotaria sp. Silwood1]|nr:unnamed protein product [Rotaria sp. Silwood1]CAF0746534.1 unnamed protein product [Rotaria sp. Silwood1]CAF3347779.1 unnamed protein product [Rotaria sp. Silwood1]CAF3360959.1 unnamed protein product [Rotaria sp. Silwood1]CAF4603824.1 unnamed protein product [Rotaria sp. Silwood1]
MLQQRQQHRFPPITKQTRFKLLKDVTQEPYRIGMVRYYPNNSTKTLKNNSGTDNDDSDYDVPDPGGEVIEKNRKDREQRIADYTKEELDKVLKRVDHTLNNYEYSVQASLLQHGMTRDELSSIEHVADVRELESLLNDSLAKQRYKQRLMVFIVGQTEQASEKAKLLQQIGQFFVDQKQNFSAAEFNECDDSGETVDEVEATLKSFDVKDCYLHVKALGNRINELNEEIIQFLIQNTGTKQTKVMVERGKRKLAQVTKEAKEQLADLQSKLEMANTEMMGKDEKIQAIEKDIETVRVEAKTSQESQKKIQDDLRRREAEVKFYKRKNNEFEEIVSRYRIQFGDIPGIGILTATSQSETEDGDDTSRMNLETIDETESKYEKESISSHVGKESVHPAIVPPTTTELTATTAAGAKSLPVTTTAPPLGAEKASKKVTIREKTKRKSIRSKKETTNQSGAEDPSETYRRSQELLESLLADKSETAPDLNSLFKPTRGIDLNIVTIDNLPTAFTNLRRFAIIRVKELLKELETKESTNKETVQILKQEFIEHKTKYEKERLLYFLKLDPEENTLQEEQNALAEKADNAHKLQLKAQKTAEEALNHLELFMVEQEKLDQQDVVRQTDLVHRHSVVVNNMTGANITPPDHTDLIDNTMNDRLSPNPKRISSSKNQWQKLSDIGSGSPRAEAADETKSIMNETVQTLQRLSSLHKTSPPRQTQRTDSIEQRQQSPSTPLLRHTTQELLRKKSSLEQHQQSQQDRSTSSSRRISAVMNDDLIPLSKVVTPQPFERTPSMPSRPLTRSNSMNPANKDHEKFSSGERSHYASGAQSRRVSIGLNRSPVRAEELERVLTKLVNEEIEALEDFRQTSVKSRTSLREKYMSLLEEKKHELDDLKQQADITLSRPTTSTKERRALESLENSTGLVKQQSTGSPLDSSGPGERTGNKENRTIKHDQQQQTSVNGSRLSSARKEKPNISPPQVIHTDQFKVPFFHLYETVYKFRHSIINLLEQNKFLSLADRLDMIKQLSISDNNLTNDFVDNSERVLKDTVKVLQTCMATLISTKTENESKQKESSSEQSATTVQTSTVHNDQSSIIQQKESIIDDLNNRYQHISEVLDQNNKKHSEELIQNERIIADQQKLIQNLQRELMRLQKRLTKVEAEGIVQPSIMFTRLDAERNETILKQAVDKGKLSDTTMSEISGAMEDYVRLPTQQFSNIVKRYIQHRKATELEDRIQSETFDNETKSVMERMGSFYERRSGKLSERISSIRQHRTTLARTLTEKFDDLEHESSIFLIRPVYSYQGRTAVQSYMENEKRQQESFLKGNEKKKKSHRSRLSESTSDQQTGNNSREMVTALSSTSASDEDERLFNIDKSFTLPRPTPASQQSSQNAEITSGNVNTDTKPKQTQLSDITRLQEFDIQRTLMPMSHASVPLSSANSNNGTDPSIPSVNLRSYVTLSRPGVGGNIRNGKTNETIHPVSRTDLSTLSVTSQLTNPRTPFNSTVGDLRRTSPPLPPIKRSLTTSGSPTIDEKQGDDFIPSVSINEFASNDHTTTDNKTEEK